MRSAAQHRYLLSLAGRSKEAPWRLRQRMAKTIRENGLLAPAEQLRRAATSLLTLIWNQTRKGGSLTVNQKIFQAQSLYERLCAQYPESIESDRRAEYEQALRDHPSLGRSRISIQRDNSASLPSCGVATAPARAVTRA